MDKNAGPGALSADKDLAQYIARKRKAMEVQADVGWSFIDAIQESYKPEHQAN
jgi:hypothetical protein